MRNFVLIYLTALSGLFVFVTAALSQDSLNVRCCDQIAHVGWSAYAYDVAISGDYAYLASWGHGVSIVNIANPGALIDVGSFLPPC